jgi:hypothetical protein
MQPNSKICIIEETCTMKENEFEKQMENLKTPNADTSSQQQILKITLLNAKKSSRFGIAFIIIPCLFLFGVFLKYALGIDFKIFSSLEDEMAMLDKTSYLKWLSPLLLVGLPLAGIVINLLVITHFYWDRLKKEFIITIKYRLVNIILLLISISIVGIFILYAIGENMRHE